MENPKKIYYAVVAGNGLLLLLLGGALNWTFLFSLPVIAILFYAPTWFDNYLYSEATLKKERKLHADEIARIEEAHKATINQLTKDFAEEKRPYFEALLTLKNESADTTEKIKAIEELYEEKTDKIVEKRDELYDETLDLKSRLLEKETEIYNATKIISGFVDKLSGTEFERFVGARLDTMGWSEIKFTAVSGDFGGDIIAVDPGGNKFCIQCKAYNDGMVGVKAIQEAHSGKGYYQCDKALVITTSEFTKNAIELAESLGVELWDHFR